MAKIEGADQFPPVLGYVYAVVNPAWPGLVKIGQTFSRLGD